MNGGEREKYESKRVLVRAAKSRPPSPSHTSAQFAADRLIEPSHVFSCGGTLLRAFEEHATKLGCSTDWLFAEALRRVLEEPVAAAVVEAPASARTTVPAPPRARPPTVIEARVPRSEPAPAAPRRQADALPLTLSTRTREGTICALVSHLMVLGRSEAEAAIRLAHSSVSRKHARFERREAGWFIVDLASVNGVYLNSVRTRCSPIAPGDVIEIGPFVISIERA